MTQLTNGMSPKAAVVSKRFRALIAGNALEVLVHTVLPGAELLMLISLHLGFKPVLLRRNPGITIGCNTFAIP